MFGFEISGQCVTELFVNSRHGRRMNDVFVKYCMVSVSIRVYMICVYAFKNHVCLIDN